MKLNLVFVICAILMMGLVHSRTNFSVRKNLNNGVVLASDSNSDSWTEIFDAFLEGAEVDKLVDNSTECVHDVEHFETDIVEAVNHFIQRGWSLENYFDILGALGDLTPTTRTCYDVTTISYTDLVQHFGKFNDFVDFVMQTKDHVVAHLFDWYDVYAKLADAIERGYPKEIARQVGRATNLLLVFTPKNPSPVALNQQVSLPDLQFLEDFMVGFLNGTKVFSSDHIKRCVNETDFMVASVKNATNEFEKGTSEGTREGVFELTDTFEHLKPLNQECYESSGEMIETIEKYISSFKDPIDILFNAVKHFNKIWKDIDEFTAAYKADEWKGMGHASGEIFYYIFFNQD